MGAIHRGGGAVKSEVIALRLDSDLLEEVRRRAIIDSRPLRFEFEHLIKIALKEEDK